MNYFRCINCETIVCEDAEICPECQCYHIEEIGDLECSSCGSEFEGNCNGEDCPDCGEWCESID